MKLSVVFCAHHIMTLKSARLLVQVLHTLDAKFTTIYHHKLKKSWIM